MFQSTWESAAGCSTLQEFLEGGVELSPTKAAHLLIYKGRKAGLKWCHERRNPPKSSCRFPRSRFLGSALRCSIRHMVCWYKAFVRISRRHLNRFATQSSGWTRTLRWSDSGPSIRPRSELGSCQCTEGWYWYRFWGRGRSTFPLLRNYGDDCWSCTSVMGQPKKLKGPRPCSWTTQQPQLSSCHARAEAVWHVPFAQISKDGTLREFESSPELAAARSQNPVFIKNVLMVGHSIASKCSSP